MAKLVELVYLPVGFPTVQLFFPYVTGMTVADVLAQAALETRHPEVSGFEVGIFAKIVARDHRIQPGDRIEIYRPLVSCPKEKRRKRAVGR
jgi:putative ubiquitin-RnfH superfamily antitoxin RatB of RatAB toxin-antitoxin module